VPQRQTGRWPHSLGANMDLFPCHCTGASALCVPKGQTHTSHGARRRSSVPVIASIPGTRPSSRPPFDIKANAFCALAAVDVCRSSSSSCVVTADGSTKMNLAQEPKGLDWYPSVRSHPEHFHRNCFSTPFSLRYRRAAGISERQWRRHSANPGCSRDTHD
jgi:hypothetical protein